MNWLDFVDFEREIRREWPNFLESGDGMSRVTSHLNTTDVAFISAWRRDNTNNVNREKAAELKRRVRNIGMAYIQLKGHWIDDVSGEPCDEDSLMVINSKGFKFEDFLNKFLDLLKGYDQDAVLVCNAGTSEAKEYHKDGTVKSFGTLSINTPSEFYSKIHSRTFHFESVVDSYTRPLINRSTGYHYQLELRSLKTPEVW